MYHGRLWDSPLGRMLVVSDGHALVGIWFEGQKHEKEKMSDPIKMDGDPICDAACAFLDGYFRGEKRTFAFPLDPQGTSFRKSVWKKLLEIPYGEVRTYGQLAKEIAKERGIQRMSSRAIGNAVSRNPIAILIPCHRVIGKDNHLVGYAGGIERKASLLAFERKNRADQEVKG